jgi:hypothetical protein
MTTINLNVKLSELDILYFTHRTLLDKANSTLELFILNENYEDASYIKEIIMSLEKTNAIFKKCNELKNKEYRKTTIIKIFNK